MKPLSIVVVEDHDALREVTVQTLAGCGHQVCGVSDAEMLDEHLLRHAVDVVVLDVNLPGEDGISICRRLRESSPRVGIVMLTVRGHAIQRALGYETGADVYLVKPTSNQELVAAIQSVGRRARGQQPEARIQLSSDTFEVRGPLGRVELTGSEVQVLRGLALSVNRELEYWQLMEALGMSGQSDAKAALEVRIVRLRKKLQGVGAPDACIKALRGVGYKLMVEVRVD
jgi:DNA-binding response OmpR family regulator